MKKQYIYSAVFLLLAWAGSIYCPPAAAQGADTQRFVVPLSNPGQPVMLEVDVMQGSITVEAYDGTEVIVEATAEESSSEIEESSGMFRIPNNSVGMTIEEKDNRVEVNTELSNRRVDFSIKVPVRTSLRLSTVNGGDIEVRGVQGELELENINGPIRALDVSGSVVADTTNGDVTVTFRQIEPDKPMSFTTFNGDVDVTLPADFRANLRMNAGRGEILSDFRVELAPQAPSVEHDDSGRGYRVVVQQEVLGTVQGGGPDFRFKTFNGSVYLRKQEG